MVRNPIYAQSAKVGPSKFTGSLTGKNPMITTFATDKQRM